MIIGIYKQYNSNNSTDSDRSRSLIKKNKKYSNSISVALKAPLQQELLP